MRKRDEVGLVAKKKESSGWLMSIIIGIIVAILLIVVMYPNFVGKKNQKENQDSWQIPSEIMTVEQSKNNKSTHFSYPH